MRHPVIVLALLLVAGLAQADEPQKPDTPGQAADKVLAAVAAKDDTALSGLAARDEPDPWLVADELLVRANADAAEAFARAALRTDTEALPGYVAAQRGVPVDAVARAILATMNAAIAELRWADALAAVDALKSGEGDVVAIRLGTGRSLALRGLRRLDESADAYRTVGDAAARVGWLAGAASALFEGGRSAYLRGDDRTALPLWERTLAVEERRANRAGIAVALRGLGLVRDRMGDHAEALVLHERALKLSEESGDRSGVAAGWTNIGNVHGRTGDYASALECYARSLKLREELGDRTGVALTLGNLGSVYERLGRFGEALDALSRALTLKEEAGDRRGAAGTLINIGLVHESRGDYATALEWLERALKLKEEVGDRGAVAVILGNIGTVHLRLGDFAKALGFQERAEEIMEELGNRPGAATTLANIGVIHERLGDTTKALGFQERALSLFEDQGDHAGVADTLARLGALHHAMADSAKALGLLERALKLSEEVEDLPGVASTLTNIGIVQRELGDYGNALGFLDRAVELSEELGDRSQMAEALCEIGFVHASRGDCAKALGFYSRALATAEEIGGLDLAVDCLWLIAATHRAAGHLSQSVAAARRAVDGMSRLARGLGEEQAASARDMYSGAFEVGASASLELGDLGEALFFLESGRAGAILESFGLRDAVRSTALAPELLEAESAARTREAAARQTLLRAVDSEDVTALKAAHAELDEAEDGIKTIIERIQREAKAAASVAYPTADSLEAIRARLREGEALVLYGLLTPDDDVDEAVALLVTARDERLVELGSGTAVEAACAALDPDGEMADVAASAAALRSVVLDPLKLDARTTRLLISPDGALSYVPFALLAPEREIVHVPSGTTYGVLLGDAAKRGEGVLALGDPDYGARPAEGVAALRGGYGDLVPLPSSGEEAKAVGTDTLLGKEATEKGLRKALAKRPRWRALHLACHGLVDPEKPLFSSLALTPSGEDDGFLTALEVFRMRAPADLVVLSACETGRGKVYEAEGIVGLTRAFMFAGAPRVLVSLWKVDDAATQALMTRFYELWNRDDGKGLAAAAALREAQAFVRSQEKWQHPRYWAAWVLWGLPE